MLFIKWLRAENPYLFRVNVLGELWAVLADGTEIGRVVVPSTDTETLSVGDGNSIEWGPSIPPDNWCRQEDTIEGELTLDLSERLQLDVELVYNQSYHCWRTPWAYGNALVSDSWILRQNRYEEHWERNGKIFTSYRLDTVTGQEQWRKTAYLIWNSDGTYTVDVYEGDKLVETATRAYDCFKCKLKEVYPQVYAERYRTMIHYVRQSFDYKVRSKIKSATGYWLASLDACQGFHPYDLNMVEGLVQFGIEDLFPKRTSSTILDILTEAIDAKGGLLSPSGLLAMAQIAGNMYLYQKYVVSGDVSDLRDILLGSDKPFLEGTLHDLFMTGEVDTADFEKVNPKLLKLAQLIVHRGGRTLFSYGAWADSIETELGSCSTRFRARLAANPRYLDDMSTAAIVLEELGVSLSWERLAAIVPYEFVAEWFIPIEETIRSVEFNADRLNYMYEVKNLCLSAKTLIPLDTPYLKAMFGLSDAAGDLSFKSYSRKSVDKFPPTAPDLSLRPGVSLSRVMQGTSLIITKL